jgi:hypothetical protein
MSDRHWSEEIRDREDEARRRSADAKEFRTHASEFIRARLPAFWESLIGCLKADVAVANEKLPHMRCSLGPERETLLSLHRASPLVPKGLRLVLNLKGHVIQVHRDTEIDSDGRPTETSTTDISVGVKNESGKEGSWEVLVLRYDGKEYTHSGPLSQDLLAFLYS